MKAVTRLMPSHGQRLSALSSGLANRSSSRVSPARLRALRSASTSHEVHHRIYRQPTHELAAIVDDGGRDEVVPFEGTGGLLHLLQPTKGHRLAVDRGKDRPGWIGQ